MLEYQSSNISKLCKKHKVKTLYAFESVLSDQFNAQRDIDLMVDFQLGEYLTPCKPCNRLINSVTSNQ